MTDTMPEKLDLASVRLSDEKLAQLRDLIPEAFTQGKIDFDALRQSLGDAVSTDPREERFGLQWPGKSRLREVINQPSVGTLVPQPNESVEWDTTQNMVIEGDNLEVLKLLQKSYAGKVKMIYLDPPYNTGNDFVYPDNHIEGLQSYLEYTGQSDENGRKLRTNTESEGRYHANWLNMMYPRLYLARNLLRQDGVVFVSIDDSEVSNLKALMNEMFGEENFFAQLVWQSRTSVQNDIDLNVQHEFILGYARNRRGEHRRLKPNNADVWYKLPSFAANPLPTDPSRFANPDNDLRGPWKADPFDAPNVRPNLTYPIVNPNTGEEHFPPSGRCWRTDEGQYRELFNDGRIVFGRTGNSRPQLKVFYQDVREFGETPSSWWIGETTGTSTRGTQEMQRLFGRETPFTYPKPTTLLSRLMSLACRPNDADLILDFFAGSGTTGHAVVKQNAEDGGNRRYIMVQLPEPLDEQKTLDGGTTVNTIADICRERVRRAGKKIAAESEHEVDTGFRAYTLAPSNFRPWDGRTQQMMTSARQASFMPQDRQLSIEDQLMEAADHIRPDASNSALLAELLLKLGFELTTPVKKETIAGKTVYSVDDDLVMICLDRQISLAVIEGMAERMPAEIICLDAGFPDDQTKVNAGQIIASQARHEGASIAFKVV